MDRWRKLRWEQFSFCFFFFLLVLLLWIDRGNSGWTNLLLLLLFLFHLRQNTYIEMEEPRMGELLVGALSPVNHRGLRQG